MMAFNYEELTYRYFLTDLLTNNIISEIPFKSVSYERTNKKAGTFSGTIPYIPATSGLNLYESTMPGRTGLYIMRNDVCVWGGIIWSRTYDVVSRELKVDGAEFMSYFYHRNVWQTLIYGTDYVGLNSYSISGGISVIVSQSPHGFSEGEIVEILGVGPALNGFYEITSVTSATQFLVSSPTGDVPLTQIFTGIARIAIDTYDFARDLIFRTSTDLSGVDFVNDSTLPALRLEGSVVSKERSNNLATIKTLDSHDVIPGQEIKLYEIDGALDGVQTVLSVPDNLTVIFESIGPDIQRTTLSGKRILNIVTKQAIGVGEGAAESLATITTDVPHGASVGQTIVVENVDSFFTGRLDSIFNGQFDIAFISSSNKIGFLCSAILDIPDTPVSGGTVTLGSRFIYSDYGSYSSNSDIDIILIEPEDGLKSGFYQETKYIRGFEQKSVGELLEEYSNNIGGFEYRIDCDYNLDTASFERIFRLLRVDDFIVSSNGFTLRSALIPSDTPEPVEGDFPRSIEYFNADKLVFEFPGNVSTFSVDESAENAATRMFVVGNDPEIGTDSYQPYAGASASDLLNNTTGLSWPLLDQTEALSDISDPGALYSFASDYLYESRPPIGEFKLTVNGSLDPQVGSYAPGEWCSIIIDDEFVRQRLESDQEPRDDIIIRKINSFKVSIPDSPHVPEKVDLDLVADWKVDRRGK
jgi:hypothetical protein